MLAPPRGDATLPSDHSTGHFTGDRPRRQDGLAGRGHMILIGRSVCPHNSSHNSSRHLTVSVYPPGTSHWRARINLCESSSVKVSAIQELDMSRS